MAFKPQYFQNLLPENACNVTPPNWLITHAHSYTFEMIPFFNNFSKLSTKTYAVLCAIQFYGEILIVIFVNFKMNVNEKQRKSFRLKWSDVLWFKCEYEILLLLIFLVTYYASDKEQNHL